MSNEELYEEITTLKEKIIFLSNKNNRLSEQLNQTKMLLEGKNNQYNWAMQKYEELKNEKAEIKKYLGISSKTIMQRLEELQERKEEASDREYRYKQTLDEIEQIAQTGLEPICYKSNCSRCKCYDGDNCNAGVTNFLNYYFDDNGDLRNDEDLDESLRDLVDTERQKCNRAMPISKKILDVIDKAKDGKQ